MDGFEISVEIAASPARVWAVMRDIERWHEWTSTVTSIKPATPGPLAVGSRAWVRQPKLLPARWQVIALEEGCSFAWQTRSPGVRIVATHTVEAAPAGARARLSLNFSGAFGWLVARLTRNLNNRYLAIEAAGLKNRCEKAKA